MGVEHDLVDRTNYRVFELGKWFIDDELFTKAQGLETFVDEVLQNHVGDEDNKTLTWRREQLKRIWAFLVVADWNVIVLGDNQCGGRHEKGPNVEFEPIYENDPKMTSTGYFEVLFDDERPEDVGREKYALVATVYGHSDEIEDTVLAPDPCAARQREVEAWSMLDRMRYLQGRSDVRDRVARRDRAEEIVRAVDFLIRAHILGALGIDINDAKKLAEIEEKCPSATRRMMSDATSRLIQAIEARAKNGFANDIAEAIAEVVRDREKLDELTKLLERVG